MPTLDEYLGGIFASLTQARMMADAQSVNMAEAYARHELLRHFAVPHLRFSDIELTIPVAIEAVQPAGRGGIGTGEREQLRSGILDGTARLIGLPRLPQPVANALGPAIDARVDRLAEAGTARPSEELVAAFAKELASDIGKLLERAELPTRRRPDAGALAELLRDLAGKYARDTPAPSPGGLQVIAESHRLREQRPSDIMIIKMSISEEGMEWQTMEMSDGRTERKLLPE